MAVFKDMTGKIVCETEVGEVFTAYAVCTNTDCTEGRGASIVLVDKIYFDKQAAFLAAEGEGPQGTHASTVPVSIIEDSRHRFWMLHNVTPSKSSKPVDVKDCDEYFGADRSGIETLRAIALAKLTDDERTLLGIPALP